MGVNHLGHFYLTHLLWDLLRTSKDLRIINVSSSGHMKIVTPSTIDFDDFRYDKGGYGPAVAYGASKLANVLFSQELASRLELVNPNARCVSLHPGVVKTELGRYVFKDKPWLEAVGKLFFGLFGKTPKQGAQTTLYAVLEDSANIKNGEYYSNSLVSLKNVFSNNVENQRKLWKLSE